MKAILLLAGALCSIANAATSGFIPGTDIFIEDVFSPFDKDLTFEQLVDSISVGGQQDRESPDSAIHKRQDGIISVCTPLTSVALKANPYHELLLSKPDANYFIGTGIPKPLVETITDCESDMTSPCELTLTLSTEFSMAYQQAITTSNSNSYTKTIGQSTSVGEGDDFAKTITENVDKSFTKGSSFSKESGWSKTVGTTVTTGWEESDTTIDTTEGNWQMGHEVREDYTVPICNGVPGIIGDVLDEIGIGTTPAKCMDAITNQPVQCPMPPPDKAEGCMNGASGGVDLKIVGGNLGINWENPSQTKGSSTHFNLGGSSSNSKQHTRTDSQSTAVENSHTDSGSTTSTTEKSETVNYGNSQAKMTTKRVDFTKGNSTDESSGNTTENSDYISISNTTVSTVSVSRHIKVDPGKCKVFICFPVVDVVVLPFLCVNSAQVYQYRYTKVMRPSNELGGYGCHYATTSCENVYQDLIPPKAFTGVSEMTDTNSIVSGQMLTRDTKGVFQIASTSNEYILTLTSEGDLVLDKFGTRIWSAGLNKYLTPANFPRARINEKGHLIVEAKNFFAKGINYRKDEYLTVWSTAPIHQNFTIGVPRNLMDYTDQYKLVLHDSGQLAMYDAVGVQIWCALSNQAGSCKHGNGYIFPEDYLVPTAFVSNNTAISPFDPHAQMDPRYTLRKGVIESISYDCASALKSGEGIVSNNGRFALVLTDGGSLEFKDAGRTMWSSYSNNVNHTLGPYQLNLDNDGLMMIRDSQQYVTWVSNNTVLSGSYPYKINVLDEGRFTVTNNRSAVEWESWPMNNMSAAYNARTLSKLCYKSCKECPIIYNNQTFNYTHENPGVIVTLFGSNTTTTHTRYPIPTSTQPPTSTVTTILEQRCGDVVEARRTPDICEEWRIRYNIDPWKNGYGSMDAATIAKADRYKCGCHWLVAKYNVDPFVGFGSLTDTNIQSEWYKNSCNCHASAAKYNVVISPKNWGTMPSKIQSRWTENNCDVYTVPYIVNETVYRCRNETYTTTVLAYPTTRYDPVTSTNTTVNIYTATEYMNRTVTNTTIATNTGYITINVTTTLAMENYPTTKYDIVNATTVGITTTFAAVPVTPSPTPTIPIPTTTRTTTTTSSPKPLCVGGSPGKRIGDGLTGACCTHSDDCKQTCKNGVCGTCSVDFTC